MLLTIMILQARAEELAIKWSNVGYLISFEGLLSTQGKVIAHSANDTLYCTLLYTYTFAYRTLRHSCILQQHMPTMLSGAARYGI
jgi:hypothetical protein